MKKNEIEGTNFEFEFHDSLDEIANPKDLDKNIRYLIVFDDVMYDKKQTLAQSYYTHGRSANCDYISKPKLHQVTTVHYSQ